MMLETTTFAKAETKQVRSELKLFGKIIADENRMVEVYPLVGGNVTSVNVELGDYVTKGQILAVIRSSEIANFERQMIDAQSDLLVAQKNLKVAEDLYAGKINSEKDMLSANKEVEKAQAELTRIKEIFNIYGIGKTSEYIVKAPISGFIIQKQINFDMQLRSDKAEAIFTVADIHDVWVMANVNESSIAQIKKGIDAYVTTLSYPDKIYVGRVDKIFNILDPQTRTMKIRINLDNSDYALKPEMNATVTLRFNEDTNMLAVPSSSIIFDKSKHFVMLFKDRNNIETRSVEIYKQLGDTTYIASGLKEGDQVIDHNQLLIYNALND